MGRMNARESVRRIRKEEKVRQVVVECFEVGVLTGLCNIICKNNIHSSLFGSPHLGAHWGGKLFLKAGTPPPPGSPADPPVGGYGRDE